jgi:hypothetical protein
VENLATISASLVTLSLGKESVFYDLPHLPWIAVNPAASIFINQQLRFGQVKRQ